MVIDFWNVLNVSLFQKRNKVKDVVLEIAHKELVLICPRCIVDSWSTPLSELFLSVFFSVTVPVIASRFERN